MNLENKEIYMSSGIIVQDFIKEYNIFNPNEQIEFYKNDLIKKKDSLEFFEYKIIDIDDTLSKIDLKKI